VRSFGFFFAFFETKRQFLGDGRGDEHPVKRVVADKRQTFHAEGVARVEREQHKVAPFHDF
jgi:hypothetical protein